MKKITQNAINAFMNNDKFCESNTRVALVPDEQLKRLKVELYLFDNLIAYKWIDEIEGTTNHYISSAGWSTSTTRERLNGLLEKLGCGRVFIKSGTMYYEDSVGMTNLLDSPFFTQVR